MALQHFIDARPGALGKIERTPQGGARVPATLARTGILSYLAGEIRRQGSEPGPEFRDSDIVRIYLPPEVLEAAMDSLRDAPVTNEHPARFVTPETYRQVACGHVVSDTLEFDGQHLKAKLVIQDAALLRDIELGARRGVSLGYSAATEYTPGTTPDGLSYHGIRRELVYNHNAVVKNPRAGASVCLALDSEEIPTQEEMPVSVKLKIRGVETDAATAQPVIDSLEGSVTALTEARDSLQKELDGVKAQLTAAKSPETIAKYVADAKSAELAAKEKADKLEAVKKAFPSAKLEGVSDAFIDGMFAAIPAQDPGTAPLKGAPAPAAPVVDSRPDFIPARMRMLQANRAMLGTNVAEGAAE